MSTTALDIAIREADRLRLHRRYAPSANQSAGASSFVVGVPAYEGDSYWNEGWVLNQSKAPGTEYRVQTWTQSTRTAAIYGTDGETQTTTDKLDFFLRYAPSEYLYHLHGALERAYPYLHQRIEDQTLTALANTYSYSVPSRLVAVSQVFVQRVTSIGTYPFDRYAEVRIRNNEGGLTLQFLRPLPVGRAIRIVGIGQAARMPLGTTLSGAVASGATTVGLTSADNVDIGTTLVLGYGTANQETVQVASISGTTATLVSATTASHSSGDLVLGAISPELESRLSVLMLGVKAGIRETLVEGAPSGETRRYYELSKDTWADFAKECQQKRMRLPAGTVWIAGSRSPLGGQWLAGQNPPPI